MITKKCSKCGNYFNLSRCKCGSEKSEVLHVFSVKTKNGYEDRTEPALAWDIKQKIMFWEAKKRKAQKYIDQNKKKLEGVLKD